MKARPGILKHRVAIQLNSPTASNYGENADSWATITNGTVWAAVEPMSAGESLRAGQPVGTVLHKITMRYRSDLSFTPKHRLVYSSRNFEVLGRYDTGEDHRYVVVTAREVL